MRFYLVYFKNHNYKVYNKTNKQHFKMKFIVLKITLCKRGICVYRKAIEKHIKESEALMTN